MPRCTIGGELALRKLVGVPLPPLRIVNPAGPSEINLEAWYSGLVVDGKKIAFGDLWGYRRPDPVLAYTIKENTISVNGWWQSNNIGARSRSDTGSGIPKGKKRFLLFGESFGEGTRVRQEMLGQANSRPWIRAWKWSILRYLVSVWLKHTAAIFPSRTALSTTAR